VDAAGNEKFSLSFKKKQMIGTWNVRSLYEGKMDVVFWEMKMTMKKKIAAFDIIIIIIIIKTLAL